MANNYYDMTGVLILDQVTPVIKALFGPFELDENYPGNGHAYVANISESSNCSWDSVLENLQTLIEELGLSLPENAEDCVKEHLHVLVTHFGADQDEALGRLIEHCDFEDDADLDSLFTIARAFNDGHGLKAYMTESAWHCSKPRLFEFGGSGDFTGLHVSVSGSSHQVVQLGEALEAALAAGDTAKATDILLKQVERVLAGVYDEGAQLAIRSKLSGLLATPKAKAVTGRIPGDDDAMVEGLTVDERKARGHDQAKLFMQELLNSVETLTGIAEQHGASTLANLMYLHSAILEDGFIDCYPNECKVLDIARSLPSGDLWVKFIKVEYMASPLCR